MNQIKEQTEVKVEKIKKSAKNTYATVCGITKVITGFIAFLFMCYGVYTFSARAQSISEILFAAK